MFGKKILWLLLICCPLVMAEPMLVKKQRFTLAEFTTFNGKTIKPVEVGWESYGQLNADKSNVVLVTHFFSGNSHAAGKYSVEDQQPGYWDAIIGPGKAIDTNKYFVISIDSLANLLVHDPHVITTGPASINPATGQPYGLSFPVVTIRDFVNIQRAVLQSLGINKLHAVIGASMGSLQALEWATVYPDQVERLISVIGAGYLDAWTVARLEHWATPIKLDANWNEGNYYHGKAPLAGLTAAMALLTQDAMHPDFINQVNPQHQPMQQQPLEAIQQLHDVNNWLQQRSAERAKLADANHLLYLVRASQLYQAGQGNNLQQAVAKIQAKALWLPASGDLVLFPSMAEKMHKLLLSLGKQSQYQEIKGQMGHLDGLTAIQTMGPAISEFLH